MYIALSYKGGARRLVGMVDAYTAIMEDEIAIVHLDDEEDNSVVDPIADDEKEDDQLLCLDGRVLNNGTVQVPPLKNVLAEIWHPIEGVTVTELENKRILFRFYNELDIKRVINGIPWFFN